MTTFMLPASSSAWWPMPMATVRTPGRFFSIAAWNFAATAASAAPTMRTARCGGVHSAWACTLASHLALHSALICGGSTLPVHLGAVIATEQLPVHVPLQVALPVSLQLPPHLPLQTACTLPEHLPSQVPPH